MVRSHISERKKMLAYHSNCFCVVYMTPEALTWPSFIGLTTAIYYICQKSVTNYIEANGWRLHHENLFQIFKNVLLSNESAKSISAFTVVFLVTSSSDMGMFWRIFSKKQVAICFCSSDRFSFYQDAKPITFLYIIQRWKIIFLKNNCCHIIRTAFV